MAQEAPNHVELRPVFPFNITLATQVPERLRTTPLDPRDLNDANWAGALLQVGDGVAGGRGVAEATMLRQGPSRPLVLLLLKGGGGHGLL